jgi:dipeptidyl aminopeptidase/acylaminoacyl peptidase
MHEDTRIRQTLEREAGRPDIHPDLEDLGRRFARRSRRRTVGTTLVGVALGAMSVAAALSLVGPLRDGQRPSADRAGSQTVVPEQGLPEGMLVIQQGTRVAVLRAGSDLPERVAGDLWAYDLSPDGSWTLGVKGRALVAIDATGAHRVLFMAPEGDSIQVEPQWSPDGSMIAYSLGSQDPADRSTLCVLALTSGEGVASTTGESTCYPEAGRVYSFDWSPDGRNIVMDGPPSDPVLRVDVQTGQVSALVAQGGDTAINRELLARGWGRSGQLVDPIWSPSGRYLAALASMETGPYSYVPVVFTPDGIPVAFGRPSTEFPYPIAWSPTVDVLAYLQGEAPYRITEVYLLDVATGDEQHLVSSEGEPYPQVTDLSWSPSGRWLALALWWAEDGYLRQALRIVDTANPDTTREFEIDTEDVTSPLVNWGP